MHGATTGLEKLAYCDSSSPCSDIDDTAHNVCATAGTDEGKVILVDHDSNASNAKAFQMCTAVNSGLTTLAASKNYFVLNGSSNKYTEYIVGVNTVGQATLGKSPIISKDFTIYILFFKHNKIDFINIKYFLYNCL